jgi:hypothetical protein
VVASRTAVISRFVREKEVPCSGVECGSWSLGQMLRKEGCYAHFWHGEENLWPAPLYPYKRSTERESTLSFSCLLSVQSEIVWMPS